VIQANTSITRNGQIYLDARLKLTLDGGSLQILPTENGETIPDSALSNFAPGSIEMRGVTVDMEPGALIEAPGANISILAAAPPFLSVYPDSLASSLLNQLPQRIYLAPGAVIDVSGLQGVERPMSDNFLTFKPFGNEFADQPLLRNSALRGQQLTVDLRQSGTLNGVNWVGTPLANLSGYATGVSRTIDQLLTTGGNVSLTAGGDGNIVLRQNSAINVGGGTVQYAGANIAASKLLTADGRIVSVSRADPLDTYVGVAGVYALEHPHWGTTTTETYVVPLLAGPTLEPGYTEGHDAGAITISGAAAYVLDGNLYGGVVAGERQRALGQRPSANDNALAMPNAGSFSINGVNNLMISADSTLLAADFGVTTALPGAVLQTTTLSAKKLSDGGFGTISATFLGHLVLANDATLTAAPGGTISLSGGSVDLEGSLVAHSGGISVDSSAHISGDVAGSRDSKYRPTSPDRPDAFALIVGSAARLDVSGLWVNDSGADPADLVGGAYIDGGSITLKTDARSSAGCIVSACTSLAGLGAGIPAYVDLTGDIVLNQGAVLDASSGGRITDHGLFMLDSKGRAAGKGGNISLLTYSGGFATNSSSLTVPPTTTGLNATIRLVGSDGSAAGNAAFLTNALKSYGFSQGGTLSLQAPSFDIGATALPGSLALTGGFFEGNGFGAYKLTSVVGHLAIAPDTTLVLKQRNFVPGNALATLPTGAGLSQIAAVDYLPDFLRQPVNLTLSSQLPLIPAAPYNLATPVPPKTILSIGLGASILGDPGAAIAINAAGQGAWSGGNEGFQPPIAMQAAGAEILGSISAPGGSIALGTTTGTANGFAQLWLGANSRLDVSGVALTDNRQTLFRTGTVLPGGSVTIVATPSDSTDTVTSVIGLHGAQIDASGSSATFDLLADAKPGMGGQQFVATQIWSDAGSIRLSAPTLLYDGTFAAHAGSAQGNGGSLTIAQPVTGGAPGSELVTVRQSGDAVVAGLTPNGPLGALAGAAVFFADRLDGSGIQTLSFNLGPGTGDAVGSGQSAYNPGTLSFSGNVNLTGLDQLLVDASQIALINTVAPTDPSGCNVCLSAGYVALRGAGNANRVFPKAGTGVLQVSAGTIDIAAGGFTVPDQLYLLSISGAAKASFISSGDIRLRAPLTNVPIDVAPGTMPSGQLISAGDLSFKAAQIYPVSNFAFTLKSIAPNGTIAFAANGPAQSAPLTAGGQITVSAARIDQSGVLLAPLGTIRLGAQTKADLAPNDPTSGTVIPTQSITFGAGSVTSVSLNGQTVPFGQTANGASWSYDSISGQPLTAPPAKNLLVTAAAINLAQGATIDLTGGGDIQAIEFVPGTGGTRDVLTGANVYAVIPGYNPAAAPIDLDFILQRHDALPAVGSSVYLSGEAGIAPGFYTLLPAHYTTLPGAYRVALVSNSGNALASQNSTLPDGTLRMAGYFANALNGSRDARLQYFDVQSSTVWRNYSEIEQTSGNSFFGARPSATSGIVPRLAVDAGHAIFSALTAVNLQGQVLVAPAAGGRGSEFDIAAQDIQILSPGAKAASGYVGLNATQLSNLGVDSLLLGGVRYEDSDGEHVTVVANSVEVSNDASAPLQGPEIILVTRVAGNNVDPNGSRGLMLDAGSVVQAKGAVVNPAQKSLIIGSNAQQINGNGNLLAVSNGSVLDVQRQRIAQNNGLITLAGSANGLAGATVSGTSITLDTSGIIRPGAGVTLGATNIAISTKSINFGIPVTQPANSAGLNIDTAFAAQLSKASNLTLRSLRTIDFNGPVNFALGTGSRLVLDTSALVFVGTKSAAVGLSAERIDLINFGSWQNPNAAGPGQLTLTASQINIGAGAKSLSGFGTVNISATTTLAQGSALTQMIALRDSGSWDAGSAALTLTAPYFLVGAKSSQSITTGGNLTLAGTAPGAVAPADEVGGTLALTGSTITLAQNALVQATAGGVTLTATANGIDLVKNPNPLAIALQANARILAGGFVSTFFDVTQAVGGGSVQLIANQGRMDIASSALIDVSSPAGLPGYAGQVGLSAPNGDIRSNGGAFNMAVIAGSVAGDRGGRLTIDAQSLGTSSLALPGMFDDAVDVHLRQGDVELASDIHAATVNLTVDGGVLTVARMIDVSGAKGGSISLFGGNRVVIAPGAQLLATASDATKRGGDVLIGTQGAGLLDLQGGLIDVSNTANAANGGTVRLRAPLTDSAFDDVAINPVQTTIRGASSVAVEGYRVFDIHNSAFNGSIDPLSQPGFYGSCNAQGVCSGTLIDFVQKFALSAAARAKFAAIPSTILHLQPGIELDNDAGDITVSNTWNLGSGIAGYLVSGPTPKTGPKVPPGTIVTDAYGNLLPQYAGYKGDLIFAPGVSQITTLFYRVGGSVTGEAPVLTLRAAGNVVINNSITDGFFNTRNQFDANYMKNLSAWINSVYASGSSTTDVSNVGGYIIAGATAQGMPLAPYDPKANGISPKFSGQDKTPITGADLFPLIQDPSGSIQDSQGTRYSAINSSSYRIVAGADIASANPLAVKPISVFDPAGTSPLAGKGNVVINGNTRYQVAYTGSDGSVTNTAYATPTIVRTGTGSIDIAAGLDFILADKTAPGVVYTAGRNSVDLPDPGFVVQTITDPLDSSQTIAMPVAT
ncbi:MAG TPA: hypothetical protein VN175_03230, partial [Rhizomicrobium sp.]|nr:hypothetical protein [Rhizomicrobium sp.]